MPSTPPSAARETGKQLEFFFFFFFLSWALYYPSWECVSQDKVKNEIFDDVEIKNIHPFVFRVGIKCICAKHLRVLDELVVRENSLSFSLPVFPPPRL